MLSPVRDDDDGLSPGRGAVNQEDLSPYKKPPQNDPLVFSPLLFFSTYNFALFYLIWHLTLTHWNLANYVAWVRFNDGLLKDRPNSAVYLTMVVLSSMAYWLVGGPMFFYAAKYAKSVKRRNRFLAAGIVVMFAFADAPLWICDMSIVYYVGFIDVGQGITWALRSVSFVLNAFVTWQVYLHRICKLLHRVVYRVDADLPAIAKKQEEERRTAKDRRKKESGSGGDSAIKRRGGGSRSPTRGD